MKNFEEFVRRQIRDNGTFDFNGRCSIDENGRVLVIFISGVDPVDKEKYASDRNALIPIGDD